MSRKKHASSLILTAICIAVPVTPAVAGTVTYAFNDIAGPVDLPNTDTPESFVRTGTGDGYFFNTFGSAYRVGPGVNVSSWTRVEIDISGFADQSVESAMLTLHVRDSVGPQDLTVWSNDGEVLASTSSKLSAAALKPGVNTLDLTHALQSRLDAGQAGLGLWFYNFYPSESLHVSLADLGAEETAPSSFTVNSVVAAPLPDSATAGLAMLGLLGIGKLILRGRLARPA